MRRDPSQSGLSSSLIDAWRLRRRFNPMPWFRSQAWSVAAKKSLGMTLHSLMRVHVPGSEVLIVEKQWEHDQLRLILENITIPFPSGSSTYAKVTSSWRQAMTGMEDLLLGRPQSISDASVLLALSSWHLFPDLIVLGQKIVNVKFKDPLFPSTGVGTIGLTSANARDRVFEWSLTLSHLRYYGDPVSVSSTDDSSRVTMEQLCMMAFGSILGSWGVQSKGIEDTATWFQGLWHTLQNNQLAQSDSLSRRFCWLHLFVQAADSFLQSASEERQKNLSLIKFGNRRGKKFLDADGEAILPYFGLCNPCVLAGLSVNIDIECGIRYLRQVAQSLGLSCGQAIIRCSHWVVAGRDTGFEGVESARYFSEDYYEYATAVAHPCRFSRTGKESHSPAEEIHGRWLHFDPELRRRRWDRDNHGNDNLSRSIKSREAQVEDMREKCYVVAEGPDWAQSRRWDDVHGLRSALWWQKPPRLYGGQNLVRPGGGPLPSTSNIQSTCPSLLSSQAICQCFKTAEQSDAEIASNDLDTDLEDVIPGFDIPSNIHNRSYAVSPCNFSPILGDRHFGLFVSHLPDEDYLIDVYRQNAADAMKKTFEPLDGLARLQTSSISKPRLWDYLCCVADEACIPKECGEIGGKQPAPGVHLLAAAYRLSESLSRSLYALSSAAETFQNLDGATIAVKLINSPLWDASWVPDLIHDDESIRSNSLSQDQPLIQPPVLCIQSRSQAFACITHLVSGTLNIDPKELELTLAMCCEDSIYVASVLLSDPLEPVASNSMRRLTGNIGQKNICMLVAPQNPKIRALEDDYRVVAHAVYDLKRDDSFKQTTLHLSFTDWALPLNIGGMRTIDQEVYFVESVISVRDRGKWVADLDVLAVNFHNLPQLGTDHSCSGGHDADTVHDYTALDSWEELLDCPDTIGIIRAHGNWVARLAAVSILTQMGHGGFIGLFDGRPFCLKCLELQYEVPGDRLKTFIPRFCID